MIEKEKYKTPNVLEREQERPAYKREARVSRSASEEVLSYHPDVFNAIAEYSVALNSPISGELKELFQQSDTMLDKTARKMPNGKPLYSCKVCGKESEKGGVRNHIEAIHMEGISIPCKNCEKTFRSRNTLSLHNIRNHKFKKRNILQ